MGAGQRLRQGTSALLAFTQPVDLSLASRYLSSEQMAIFGHLRRSEQLHSLSVLRAVLSQSPDTPLDLAVAALLHDVGKARYPFPLWQKTMVVLVRAFARPLYHRLKQGSPGRWWQRPFVIQAQHPAWSAEMVAPVGTSQRALWLIEHHQTHVAKIGTHPDIHLLQRLQTADDAN